MSQRLRPLRALLRTAVLAATLGVAQAQAPTDLRVALVIGNAAYPAPATLNNPVNDAKAMADALRRVGFTVMELTDASQAQMLKAVEEVRGTLKGRQGIGMLYYAGHGLQVDWRNFMVPVDAKLASSADVPQAAVDVGKVIDAFKDAGTRMNILVLDACRDNPFADKASGKGLAPLDAPTGTFLAYATAPGNVALDGDGMNNSLYTAALVQELQKPVARIEDIFKRVRLQVRQKTQGRQIPWESTSLEDDFVFNTGQIVVAPKPDNRAREEAYNAQKADWEKVKDSRSPDDLYAFLQKHPSGSFAEYAQSRLELIQKSAVQAQPVQGAKASASLRDRYREGDTYTFVTRDGLTNVVTDRSTLEIRMRGEEEFEGVVLSGNTPGARANWLGFVIADGGGTYDPPWSVLPGAEFQVGKRASGRSIVTRRNGVKEWIDFDTRIAAREKIQTEAFGTVDTYRVEVELVSQGGLRARFTFWFDPDVGYSLRLRQEFRRGGAPDIRIREMVARSRKS